MAGKKVRLNSSIKASSILEVVVSMVVIVIVFGIAMMIYTNVMRMSLSETKLNAKALLQQTLLQTENSGDCSNKIYRQDSLTIEQEVIPYNNQKNLLQVRITAFDNNKQTVAEVKKVIIKNK